LLTLPMLRPDQVTDSLYWVSPSVMNPPSPLES
jgi:hypothetical protein